MMSLGEIEEHIKDLFEGILDAEKHAALATELRERPEARRLYQEHYHIHLGLQMRAQLSGQRGFGDIVPIDRVVDRQRRRALRFAMAVAAVILLAVGIVSYVIILPEPLLAHFETSPETQYTVTHLEGADRGPDENVLLVGTRLAVRQGTVKLDLLSGVTGIVRGPAALVLESEERIELAYGTVWFRVPEEAVGFQINTPDMLVTDLGTSFGVRSESKQPDEVHVFAGSVEVTSHADPDNPITLLAKSARRVLSDGGWEDIPLDIAPYLTELPTVAPLPPYLHWSFDARDGSVARVGGTHRKAKSMISRIRTQGEGPVSQSSGFRQTAAFDAQGDGIDTNWYGVGGNAPRTVAFWIKLHGASGRVNRTLVSWGASRSEETNREWAIRVTNIEKYRIDSREGINGPGAPIRPQLFLGCGWLVGDGELHPDRWHHIAVAFNGKADRDGRPLVDFYVDGEHKRAVYATDKPNASQRIDTDIESDSALPLVIGRSRKTSKISCDAEIDELYIFDSYLTADYIDFLASPPSPW